MGNILPKIYENENFAFTGICNAQYSVENIITYTFVLFSLPLNFCNHII